MDIKILDKKKLGKKGKEEISTVRVSRKKGQLTMNDIHKLKEEIRKKALEKYKNFELKFMVLRNGGSFKTATDENQLLEYFTDLVKDPTKFTQFDSVDFQIIYS
jgi:hypothetical protein